MDMSIGLSTSGGCGMDVLSALPTIDCSTNPNYPATNGIGYRVSVAGKIGGAAGVYVHVNDILKPVSTAVSGAHAAVGDSWVITRGQTKDVPFEIIAPNDLYSVVGVASNVYFDSLLKEVSSGLGLNFDVAQTGSAGSHLLDKWTSTPGDTTDNNTTTTFYVYDVSGKMIDSHAATYHVASAASHGSANVLYIGDSLTAGADVIVDLIAYDTADSNLSLTFIGTQDNPNFNEGYSGQTISWFYTHADSPFVKAGVFDYPAYLADNSLATPDIIFIQLGVNDFFSLTSDSACDSLAITAIGQLQAMITAFVAVNTGTRVVINLTTLPSTQTLMGGDYGVNQTLWRVKRNYQIFNKALIANTWDFRVKLLPVGLNIDRVNNMINGVHPTADGYQEISNCVYSYIKNIVPVNIAYHDILYNDATRLTTSNFFTLDNAAGVVSQVVKGASFNGFGVTFKASEKTQYDINFKALLPLNVTTLYLGVKLWNGANKVDYDLPAGSCGTFISYLGYLNYYIAATAYDVWNNYPTTINLTDAPDFTHITLCVTGLSGGTFAVYAQTDLNGTYLRKH